MVDSVYIVMWKSVWHAGFDVGSVHATEKDAVSFAVQLQNESTKTPKPQYEIIVRPLLRG